MAGRREHGHRNSAAYPCVPQSSCMWRAGTSGPSSNAVTPWHIFTSEFPFPLKRQHKGCLAHRQTLGNQPHENTVCWLFPASELLAWMGWGQDVPTATAQAASVPCLFFTFSILCCSSLPLFLRGKFLELVHSPLQPNILGFDCGN